MKRSEMLALLTEDLQENHGLDFLVDYPETVAKEILDLLESKGMLPPTINEWVDVSGTFLGDGFQVAKKVNKWEEE